MPLGRDGSLGRRLPGRERRRRRRCIHALQTIPRLQHRMPLQEAPFTLNGLAPQLGTELRGGHDTVFAGLGRGKVNTVAGMNQCRRGGFRTVDGELGGDGGGAIEHIAPPVYPKQQVFAAAADEIGIAVPIHHQQLQHRKAPAAEELGGAPVEQHLITVADKAEAGRDSDTERGGIFRIRQREGIGVGAGLKITSCQRCAFGIYAEGRGHPGTEGGELAPTAGQKDGGGRTSIDLADALCDLIGQSLDGAVQERKELLRRQGLLQPQNIGKAHTFTAAQLQLHGLGRGEVHQACPHQGFRDFVACYGSHSIPHHAAVPAYGDVRRTSPDVHQGQVEKTEIRRNRGI